jgi:hypothetical protein
MEEYLHVFWTFESLWIGPIALQGNACVKPNIKSTNFAEFLQIFYIFCKADLKYRKITCYFFSPYRTENHRHKTNSPRILGHNWFQEKWQAPIIGK